MLRRASVPLPLAGFGLELLHEQADRDGVPLETFMAQAAERYLAERNAELPSSRVPDFLKEGEPRVGDATADVELDAGVWSALEQEAEAQNVPMELLVTHAGLWLAARPDNPPAG